MRTVCYIVQTMTMQQGNPEPQVEENVFFGPVDEVNKELRDAEKLNAQGQITHANDPPTLAVLKNREQIIKALLTHDLDTLPVHPRFGSGQGQCRFECCPQIIFVNNIKVSIRGTKSSSENHKPINILLPNGIRIN